MKKILWNPQTFFYILYKEKMLTNKDTIKSWNRRWARSALCLSGCLYPINVKTAKPIGLKFCVGPHLTLGKVYEWSKFQKFVFKSFFYFCKILKMREKILWNPQTFFLFLFLLYKEKVLTDKATIRSLNRRWARSALKA